VAGENSDVILDPAPSVARLLGDEVFASDDRQNRSALTHSAPGRRDCPGK